MAAGSRARATTGCCGSGRAGSAGGRTGRVPDNTYSKPNFGYTDFINTSVLPVTLPVGLTWGADYHLPTTYSMTYVFNVQRVLGDKMADPSLKPPDAIFHEQGRLQRFRFSNTTVRR